MKKVILVILLIVLFCQRLFASFSLFNVENLNNQLSNNAILCMHQDSYGFMWFGTYDGLNLYDGKKVTIFRFEADNPNSLLGNIIHNIVSAGNSDLWIATQMGLNKFSLKERKVIESYPGYKKVDLIASDNQGNTWIVNKDGYISYYDTMQKKIHEIPMNGANANEVKSIFLDKEERICLVKKNGILQYITLKTGTESHKTSTDLSIQEQEIAFHSRAINQVFYEDGQIYFIDEDRNLFVYDNTKQQKILLRNIDDIVNQYGIISSLRFFQNEIYLAFMHSGLIKFDASTHDKRPELINMSIGIFGILKDRYQDAMWIGTDGQGAAMYCNEKDKFGNIMLSSLPFMAKRPIRAFYTDEENTLWIGTKGDGIIRIRNYDKFKNTRIPIENVQRFVIGENPVYSFVRSKYNKNDLWIGTDGNVSYYSYKDNKIYAVKDLPEAGHLLTNVHSFCEVNDSTLWLSSKGLYKVIIDKSKNPYVVKSKKSYTFKKDNIRINDEFYSMIYDGDSTLFLGSRGGYGVSRFNIYDKSFRFILMDKAKNKALGDVICVYIDKDSVLYIGTSSGLTQIKQIGKKENEIKQFNRNDGILNDMIHGILEDSSGIIWLSTSKGLVKYNPLNDSFFNVKSLQIGVTEYSDDAYWKCPITDRLFFGGVNGLVWVEPKDGREGPSYEPDLLFTELNCFGKEQMLYEYNEDPTEKLKLKSDQNTFQISFAVLDYVNGDNYDYFYLLENYNTSWISLKKENKINFTNLPPGEYTLKVKYRNDVLSADDKVYSLCITILPPWYLSLVAYVAYAVSLFLLSFFIVYYVKKKFLKKQYLVAQRIKEEQKEKLYESKLIFFTNITHELYTPLTLINGALEQIQRSDGNTCIKKYTDILQHNVLSLNELIQEILDFRKIEESEIKPHILKDVSVTKILNNLLTSFSEIAWQNHIELVDSIPENLFWNTDSVSFKKIVSNLLSNAFKYTPVGGIVKVNVSVESDSLKIVVYNTGKGIEPDKIETIFNRYHILENTDVNANNQMTARNGLGLFICHSMTKLLQGEVTVVSVVNEYVEFTVILPNLVQTKEIEVIGSKPHDNKETEEKKIDINNVEEATFAHVLIVDDNKEIVEMVGDFLSPYCHVLQAFNVTNALSIIKNQTPSLIITDIMMPEIDGLSFIQIVREDKYCKHVPIIALSAKTDHKDQAKGYNAGADAYITKPFSSDVLISIVCRFLANKEVMKSYYYSAESSFEYTEGKLVHQKDKEFIEEVLSIIRENISNVELGPEFIAEQMKMSSRNLYRQLKKLVAVPPSEFIKEYKLSYAAKLLLTTNMSVKEIIYKIGITNKSYFYNEFAKKYNASPKQFKSTNAGEQEQIENSIEGRR